MGPPRGTPQKPENKEKTSKNKRFLSKTRFLASPGRDLSNRGGIFRFGALRGTGKFRYIFRQFFAKIPIPIQAFASCGAGSYAFPWTDQVPELRIYVVGGAGGFSFGPKSKLFAFFKGSRQGPSSCLNLKYAQANHPLNPQHQANNKLGMGPIKSGC